MSKPPIVALVSHDAGGAEVLASYVKQTDINCRLVLEGPAVGVFKRRLGEVDRVSLTEALASCDWCLCGTSWQSDLEWSAIQRACKIGKHVVAYLDHWVNYRERFVRNGLQFLPNEIWVGDQDALHLASEIFRDTPIKLVPNPYFLDMKADIALAETKQSKFSRGAKLALFLSENVSGHAFMRYGDARHWGYTEFDAIEYFLHNLPRIDGSIRKVVIRPHPSDPPGKYDKYIRDHPGLVGLSDGRPLIEEIVAADIVASCQSMAMVVALQARKRVICCIPPSSYSTCGLPQKDIVMLRDIASVDAPSFVQAKLAPRLKI